MVLEIRAERSGKLLTFLRRELRLSTTMVNRLKAQNAMFVEGKCVHTDYPVAVGDLVSVRIEEPPPDYPEEDGPLRILYEDEALLCVDKPPGLLVHPSRCRNTGTLANRVAFYYRKTGQPGPFHPVSRLDRDTFGVVLLAKNAHIHALLGDAARQGLLQKTYRAAVYGAPPEDEGVIGLPIARLDPRGLLRGVREDGQSARTEYRVLRKTARAALVELHPRTGRTHQLRVHLSAVGCPILGDPQYGTEASQAFSLRFGLTGQQLCAAALRFPHPLTGEPLLLCSEQDVFLPPDDGNFA